MKTVTVNLIPSLFMVSHKSLAFIIGQVRRIIIMSVSLLDEDEPPQEIATELGDSMKS